MAALTQVDFEALAEFRYQLRRFLRFAERSAKAQGVTPLQYLLLLHVKGYPARPWASVGELAERLQGSHHTVVALVSRCERAGLVERRSDPSDRRRVLVHLTSKGTHVVARIATSNRSELRSLSTVFRVAHISAFNGRK
jgi:DNA-binding MarR family transcriptional regulator